SDRREADRLACYDLATSPRASPAAGPRQGRSSLSQPAWLSVPSAVWLQACVRLRRRRGVPLERGRGSARRPPAPPASPSTRPLAPTLAARHRGSRSRLSASSTPFAVLSIFGSSAP